MLAAQVPQLQRPQRPQTAQRPQRPQTAQAAGAQAVNSRLLYTHGLEYPNPYSNLESSREAKSRRLPIVANVGTSKSAPSLQPSKKTPVVPVVVNKVPAPAPAYSSEEAAKKATAAAASGEARPRAARRCSRPPRAEARRESRPIRRESEINVSAAAGVAGASAGQSLLTPLQLRVQAAQDQDEAMAGPPSTALRRRSTRLGTANSANSLPGVTPSHSSKSTTPSSTRSRQSSASVEQLSRLWPISLKSTGSDSSTRASSQEPHSAVSGARPESVELSSSLEEALARYRDEVPNKAELWRLRLAFRRFSEAGISQVACEHLQDVLLHLGYATSSGSSIKDLAAEVSTFAALDFQDICNFVDKFNRRECAETHKRIAAWMEGDRSGDVSLEGLQIFLATLGIVTTRSGVEDMVHKASLHRDVGFSAEEFLRLLAARRVNEGFSRHEVEQATTIFMGLEQHARGSSSGHMIKVTELRKGLLSFCGDHSAAHLSKLLERTIVEADENAAGVSLYEFLIWARRLHDVMLSEAWEQFTIAVGTSSSTCIERTEVIKIAGRVGFTLTQQAVTELLAQVNMSDRQSFDFDAVVAFMASCRLCQGFTQEEAAELSEAYDGFEKDKDNQLDGMQVLDMMRACNPTIKFDHVQEFINHVDHDLDGIMDKQEYMRFMRIQREHAIRRARDAFNHFRGLAQTMPLQRLPVALEALGLKHPELLGDDWKADRKSLGFDDFLSAVDRLGRITAARNRKRAGFSEAECSMIRAISSRCDPESTGKIKLGDLVRMLAEADLPVNTKEGRKQFFRSLEYCRAEAAMAHADDEECKDVTTGSEEVHFWVFVRLVRTLVRDREREVLATERAAIEETKFSPCEVAEFRKVFSGIKSQEPQVHENACSNRETPAVDNRKAQASTSTSVPTLQSLLGELVPSASLHVRDVKQGLRSLGLKVPMDRIVHINEKLKHLAAGQTFLDFAGFLRFMRFVLDNKVMDVNGADESAATSPPRPQAWA